MEDGSFGNGRRKAEEEETRKSRRVNPRKGRLRVEKVVVVMIDRDSEIANGKNKMHTSFSKLLLLFSSSRSSFDL